ncbi:type IX secretion system membrane protein PorP/SprF [Leptobacterium flavescens]|uniref:Type IX secretion system membrane protein PorP/SprF n=1 Tax=Leptobacterium flavescens TaxID=472055 RepID=A0A6P0UQG1_9FLAO|nr:type IX secretion system membrane protein PorP/SprF [Leptobacterium flavescens]NER12636.1 type IX secretion system membrane protein PorP/SprF [Leptobacterium flavescens]
MKKNILFILLSFFWLFRISAQEGLPVYFDYLSDNYYLIHPAMAGVGQGGKVRLTARQQWFDVNGAPNLQTLNGHLRVGDRSGVGAIIFNDENGFHSQTGLKLTYAHHLLFSRNVVDINQLSFGLSVGVLQSNLDETGFTSFFPDPIITGTKNSVSYFNVDFGISYNFLEFYAHLTVQNALGTGRDLYTAQEFDNLRRYLVSAGYVFGKGEWQFEPSFLFQATEFTNEKTVDINAKVYKDVEFGKVWGGLSYRRSFDGAQFNVNGTLDDQKLQLITPILGVNYKNFVFAYTYSYQTGDIRIDNGGFHQITLGLNFLGAGSKPYDCNCPAVNY